MSSKCINELKKQGFSDNQLHTEPFLHLRYDGTDCALMCSSSNDGNSKNSSPVYDDFLSGFLARYIILFVTILFLYFLNFQCNNIGFVSNIFLLTDIRMNLDLYYLDVKYM